MIIKDTCTRVSLEATAACHLQRCRIQKRSLRVLLDARTTTVRISGPVLLGKARDLASLLNFPEYGIVYKFIVGEAAFVDIEKAEQRLADNPDEIYSYAELDIFNADETASFHQMRPVHTRALKRSKCVGSKHSKVHITVPLCCSVHSSDDDRGDGGDGVAPSPPVSTTTALGRVASPKQLVYCTQAE
ncbi:hypothetical protein HPB47_024907 [Ixodes persulcatus]|uniref:Uncharacterized protein n=1 Tax=Ixodes persulcatus TaxID=34615 RepID=A0AC60Q3N8_IXOPE|nr:hypothetical protein HPB47_024907 [Ixodes persulcatus]